MDPNSLISIDEFTILENYINVYPYGKAAKVTERKILDDDDLNEIKDRIAILIDQDKKSDDSAFCHNPTHAVKFFRGDAVIFESTFSWDCGNFGFRYPDEAVWLNVDKGIQAFLGKKMPPFLDRRKSK